jgi:hypothetical protein
MRVCLKGKYLGMKKLIQIYILKSEDIGWVQ